MKVSVIIPVYNSEKYLDECIQSVLNQSFTDYELLLINDGSTDSSGAICDSYAAKDNRVKVLYQENGGVSSARNLGLENAKGDWITFIDSDDYISKDYFSPILEFSNQDFILINLNREQKNNEFKLLNFEPQNLELKDFLDSYQVYPHFFSPCGKFYKTSLIIDNQLKFDRNLHFGEDSVFNLHYVFKCNKIALTNVATYYYRYTSDGLSKKKFNVIKDDQYFYEQTLSVLESNLTDTKIISENVRYPLYRFFFSVLRSDLNREEKRIVLKRLLNKHKSLILKSLRGERIHLIPIHWFIRLELWSLLIVLIENTRTS